MVRHSLFFGGVTVKKRILMITVVLLLLIAVLYGVWALTMNPYRGVPKDFVATLDLEQTLTRAQAAEDIRQVHRYLKTRHPAWLLDQPLAEQMDAALETAEENLPEAVTVLQLWQELGRCLHLLNDGHTRIWASPRYQLYLSDLTPLQKYGVPLTIQNIETEQFVQKALPLLSYEMEEYVRQKLVTDYIQSEHWMNYLGVDTTNGVSMTFETETGEQTFHFGYVISDLVQGVEETPWVSYEIDQEKDLGIFHLSSCVVNDEYKKALDDFFLAVFENEISRIVVDLRGNGGGNSAAANLFIQYLNVERYKSWAVDGRYGWYLEKQRDITIENRKKPRVFEGTVYVLTDIETYSAGKDFAMLLADNEIAIHVGQAPGNLPDCYMDILRFQLPHSGLVLDVSWKRVYRIDESKSGLPLEPDHMNSEPLDWIIRKNSVP